MSEIKVPVPGVVYDIEVVEEIDTSKKGTVVTDFVLSCISKISGPAGSSDPHYSFVSSYADSILDDGEYEEYLDDHEEACFECSTEDLEKGRVILTIHTQTPDKA